MMQELTVTASDARERLSDLLENVDSGRVLISKHGVGKAYLIGVRELRALEETLAILDNRNLMDSIERGLKDFKDGRLEDADDVFAELDAELRDEG